MYSLKALGSILYISSKDKLSTDEIKYIEIRVFNFEKKYSRFIKWNFLDKLNGSWSAIIDREFKALFNLSLTAYKISKGHFDITILPLLENNWYWIKKSKLDENIWMNNIKIKVDKINLNWTMIEFWSVWKWYLVDEIYNFLKKSHKKLIINFGWDIKIWEESQTVWLEDPYDESKIIWKLKLSNMWFASSSWIKRKLKNGSHLINSIDKKSLKDKISVYTTHKLCTLADIFSTLLYVTPLDLSLQILENTKWLEWLIINSKWEIFKSKGFKVEMM